MAQLTAFVDARAGDTVAFDEAWDEFEALILASGARDTDFVSVAERIAARLASDGDLARAARVEVFLETLRSPPVSSSRR